MDNNQLYVAFYNIGKGNPLEVNSKLKKLKKEYKASDFYKQTKMPIRCAYNMFKRNMFTAALFRVQDFLTTGGIASKISEILDNIDSDSLQNFIDAISEVFNTESLDEQKGDLTSLLSQLKSLSS